jgi:hypothetical protein
VVSTVLTYAGVIRCDRAEAKRKKNPQKLSKKEEVQTPKEKKKPLRAEA